MDARGAVGRALEAPTASVDHSWRSLTALTMADFGEPWTQTKQEQGDCLFDRRLYCPTVTPDPSSASLFSNINGKIIDH